MRKMIALTLLLISLFLFIQPSQALEKTAGGSAVLKNETPLADERLKKLTAFLEDKNSPLADYAAEFVASADQYKLDWKLIPAIAGVESSFGKKLPAGSFNAYGWANGQYYFESWEESINHVSRVLKEKYLDRGLDTPLKIGPVYAPPSPAWASRVAFFMEQINCFGDKNCPLELEL